MLRMNAPPDINYPASIVLNTMAALDILPILKGVLGMG